MAKFSIWFGVILMLFGLIAYFGTTGDSLTALIPCLFSILFIILGVVAHKQKYKTKAIGVAIVLALLGVAGTLGGVVDLFYEASPAAISKSVMAALCFIYVLSGLKSIIGKQ